MVEAVSGDLEHTCPSHHTATCRFMHEESASVVEMEVPITHTAEGRVKVIEEK